MKYLTNKILHLQYLHTKHLIVDITYQGMLKKNIFKKTYSATKEINNSKIFNTEN